MAATGFHVNTNRYDPYKNFKFKIWWDARVVAGVSKISAIKRTTEVVTHRDGGNENSSNLSPGTSKFEAVTLERGVTHDPEFEEWAGKVYQYGTAAGISLKEFRKNIRIELCNEEGTPVKAYNLYRCWVSEYQALPELDANGNAVAIENIVIQHEGWLRDESVTEPEET